MGLNKYLNVLSFIVLALLLTGCADNKNTDKGPLSGDTESPKQLEGSIYERTYSPSIGAASAKVTIVEFFDPACEACKAFYPIVKEILSRHPDDVRLVLRYATLHKDSETVVRLLEASRLQNLFEPVLDALIENQEQWASHRHPNVERAWEIAESQGLNIESAKAIMNSEAINKIVDQEMKDLVSLGVQQTPTFFVNEKPLTSFGAQELYDLVVSELTP
jgi:protein-disulfide isomerase